MGLGPSMPTNAPQTQDILTNDLDSIVSVIFSLYFHFCIFIFVQSSATIKGVLVCVFAEKIVQKISFSLFKTNDIDF